MKAVLGGRTLKATIGLVYALGPQPFTDEARKQLGSRQQPADH